MPIYVFACPEHGEFEAIVKIGTEETHCSCGSLTKKVVVPLHFAISNAAVEIKDVGGQGVIVKQGGRRYFRPNPEVVNKERGLETAKTSHKKNLEKDAKKRDLTKDEERVLFH